MSASRGPWSLLALAAGLTVAGKLAAFLKDVVLAYCFGVGPATDAYFIANAIPGFLWISVYITIGMVFLPLYVEYRERSPREVEHFVNEAVLVYAVAGLGVTLLCVAAAGPIVRFTASSADPGTLALARELTWIMAIGFVFSGYVGVQNAVQQANGRFIAPLTVPVVNNLLTMAGTVIAAHFGSIHFAVAAAVLGWVVQAAIQRLQTRAYYSGRFPVRVSRKTVNRLFLLSGPVMLGVFLDQINLYVGISLSGRFGEGAISHLSYAGRLATFLAGLFSWLVAYFLFPRIAAGAARRDDADLARAVTLGCGMIALLTAPLVVLALLASRDIIAIVYGRGAYGRADVAATALVFAAYAYGILFIAFRELLSRVFFSCQRNYVPLVAGALATGANLVLSYQLSRRLGVSGIALGASLAAICYAAIEFAYLLWWKPHLLTAELARILAAVLVAAGAAFGATALLVGALADWSPLPRLLVCSGVLGVVYGGVAIGGALAFGVRVASLRRLW